MTRYPIAKSLSEDNFNHKLYSQYFENHSSNNVAQISENIILKVPAKPNPKMIDAAVGNLVSLIPLEILIPGIIVFGILSEFFGDNNS